MLTRAEYWLRLPPAGKCIQVPMECMSGLYLTFSKLKMWNHLILECNPRLLGVFYLNSGVSSTPYDLKSNNNFLNLVSQVISKECLNVDLEKTTLFFFTLWGEVAVSNWLKFGQLRRGRLESLENLISWRGSQGENRERMRKNDPSLPPCSRILLLHLEMGQFSFFLGWIPPWNSCCE